MKVRTLLSTFLLLALIASLIVPAVSAQGPGTGKQQQGKAVEAAPEKGIALDGSITGVNTDYAWSQTLGTYTEITGGTLLTTSCDDTNYNANPIPFTFTFNGTAYTQFSLNCNGFIAMGATVSSSYTPISQTTTNNVIAPLGGDQQTNATNSDIRYETLGDAPNRVLVIQWRNFRHYGATGDIYNYQIRLYETSNLVEVVYGPFTQNATNRTSQVGLRGLTNADFNNRKSTAEWINSVAGTVNTDTMALTSVYVPPSGLTWDWTPLAPHPIFDASYKLAPSWVLLNGSIAYTVHIKNTGTGPANAATMLDPIPPGTTYNYDVACSSGTCGFDGTNVTWSGTVAVGGDETVSFSVGTAGLPCGTIVTNQATMNDPGLLYGPVTRSASTMLIYAAPFAEEGFEVSVPPPGWTETIVNDPGTDPDWSQVNAGTYPTINPHGGTYMAKFNSYNASANASARLATPALDFSTAGDPRVSFYMSHDNGYPTNADSIQVQVSTDGGLTWANVGAPILRYDPAYTAPGWGYHTVDLSAYAGAPSVMVGFLGISAYGNNFYLDDVSIFAACQYVPPAEPDIYLNPTSLSQDLCPNATAQQTLQVCNNGGADLTWALTEQPTKALWEAPAVARSREARNVGVAANPTRDPAITPQAPKLAGTVLLDQQPNQASGYFSDANCDWCGGAQTLAENFALEGATTLEQIALWGGFYTADIPGSPDVIRVLIHQDAAGLPGAVVYDENNIAYSRAQTGVILFGVHEYLHVLTLGTPAVLPPGNYWVEIFFTTGVGDYDDYFWETGNPDTQGRGLLDAAVAFQAPGQTWYYPIGTELAFQLIGSTTPSIPWLSEDPVSGTVPAGQCQDVTITFNSTGLLPGAYGGNLLVDSNDPDEPQLTVPVSLTVLEPVHDADFSWVPPNPLEGEQVTFTATAQGVPPINYTWDFGDGGGGGGAVATHTYAAPGNYLVTLTASNGCGQQVVQKVITVSPLGCTWTNLLFDDFEGGFGNWTADGLWNVEAESDPCGSLVAPFPSPVFAGWYGIDGQCTYNNGAANAGNLTLNFDLDLSSAWFADMNFWSREQTECGGNCYYDNRYIQVSTDGGATWTTIGEGNLEGVWYNPSFDLGAYLGGTLRLRFRFDTVDSIANSYFGWMVDNVTVRACVPSEPDIDVTPTSLTSEQYPDEVTLQTLQVFNTGNADLTWTLTEAAPPLGAAKVTIPARSAKAPAGTAVGRLLGEVSDRAQTTYTVQGRAGIQAPPNVLLLNADDDNSYGSPIQTMLQAYGDLGAVDLYDARYSTPTLAQLQAYDVVLVWSNYYFASATAIGDVLADYVDAGGKVIDLMFGLDPSWGYQGRFRTQGYTAMTTTSYTFGTLCLGAYDPLHPIMAGVTNVCEYYRGTGTALTAGSSAVAYYADNSLFVAVKDNGTVATINAYVGYYYLWTGQMADVVHNAILWLAVPAFDIPWLSESPTSGTVLPGEHQDVTVTFDSTGMTPGDYYANLLIDSNDPDEPTVTVPVHLKVLSTCVPPYDADFSYTPDFPIPAQPVHFTATAQGDEPLAYDWDFGDGTTGSGPEFYHAYTYVGTYLVTLTVSNACGQAVVQHEVLVQPPQYHYLHLLKQKMNWRTAMPPFYKAIVVGIVHDENHGVLAGVTVTGHWTFPDGSQETVTMLTDLLGRYKFKVRTTMCGLYQFDVDGLALAGYIDDPAHDHSSRHIELLVPCD